MRAFEAFTAVAAVDTAWNGGDSSRTRNNWSNPGTLTQENPPIAACTTTNKDNAIVRSKVDATKNERSVVASRSANEKDADSALAEAYDVLAHAKCRSIAAIMCGVYDAGYYQDAGQAQQQRNKFPSDEKSPPPQYFLSKSMNWDVFARHSRSYAPAGCRRSREA